MLFVLGHEVRRLPCQGGGNKFFIVRIQTHPSSRRRSDLGGLFKYPFEQFLALGGRYGVIEEVKHADIFIEDLRRHYKIELPLSEGTDDLRGAPLRIQQAGQKNIGIDNRPHRSDRCRAVLGVRVRVQGGLGNARVFLQIDIGFGDVIVPGPSKVTYPALLDFPAPELTGYTMESTIAEKFHTMVKLGVLNSRMKDFYDIWMLSRTFDFRGELLAEAVEKTFENRNTPITITPTVFGPSFVKDGDKEVQWQGFIRKAKLADAPDAFEDVVAAVKAFFGPLVASLAEGRTFRGIWKAPGPWRKSKPSDLRADQSNL